jgi:hypothetical protein
MLIDKRWHSSIIDVDSCRGAGSDTGRYLVLTKLWERLLVKKTTPLTFGVQELS